MANNIPPEFIVDGKLCCVLRTEIKSTYYCAHNEQVIKTKKKTFIIKTCVFEDGKTHEGVKVTTSSGEFVVTDLINESIKMDKNEQK